MKRNGLIVIVMVGMVMGCGKKESSPRQDQAKRDSATALCMDAAKQWCDSVKTNEKMQVTECNYVPGLYQETDTRNVRTTAFATTTAFKGQQCGDKSVRTKWTFDCRVQMHKDKLVAFKVIEPGKLPFTLENCVD